MFPQSIRWRLPITYAAIALITALTLGVGLLTMLNRYYHWQEKSYLKNYVSDLEPYLSQAIQEAPPEILAGELDPIALFTQIRIQLLDADRLVIYDSGPPNQLKDLEIELIQEDDTVTEGVEVEGGRLVRVATDLVNELFIYTVDVPTSGEHGTLHLAGYTVTLEEVDLREGGRIVMADLRNAIEYTTPYPIDINTAGVGPGEVANFFHRSKQHLEVPIHDTDDNLVGYLELFDGPAFGQQIVERVARVWAIASVFAVLFAALVGWWISRWMSAPLLNLNRVTEQMAGGNLAVRADITQRGEIGQLAFSFNSMACQVEKTISTLRQFVSDAAHQLHTPLTSLRTNLDLIIDAPDDSRRLREFAERARIQTDRLQKLTSDLLELSRMEAKIGPSITQTTNLPQLLREYSELYASWVDQSNLSLITDLPHDEMMVIPLNDKQTGHIIHNLLENAIKFTPPGGTITLGLRRGNDVRLAVEMWVEDTGIGIPVEDLPHLFERFHRGQNAMSQPGHGLGLAIVRLVVESCGGTIRAQNTASGTRFTVLLPLVT